MREIHELIKEGWKLGKHSFVLENICIINQIYCFMGGGAGGVFSCLIDMVLCWCAVFDPDASNSSWAEMEPYVIGSYSLRHPLSVSMKARLVLQYLATMGDYQEVHCHKHLCVCVCVCVCALAGVPNHHGGLPGGRLSVCHLCVVCLCRVCVCAIVSGHHGGYQEVRYG